MGNENSPSSPRTNPAEETPEPVYEIRVKGCEDHVFWSDWFGDMKIIQGPDQGETTLRGSLADQTALYGLLTRLRNKGLVLISVQQMHQDTSST